MPSKILSFICHVPAAMPSAYASVSTAANHRSERRAEVKKPDGGHFTAIYENDRFVRFKYINHAH